jgi:hypothetical protein
MPGPRDGQLRIHRGMDDPPWALQMFDDDLALWLTLCQANVEEAAMRQGIPILRGPYLVDYTDIPHEGDTMTLWTPQVGDVLLRLFPDWQTVVNWDSGGLRIGQNVADDGATITNAIVAISPVGDVAALDMNYNATAYPGTGPTVPETAYVFHTSDPVSILLARTGGTDATQGHVELYALVARAVAP